MNHRKTKKGFTLVEIMIVVVIIGLLAAMAVPAFNKVREQAREKAITNNLRQVASLGQQFLLEGKGNGSTVTYTMLVNQNYLPDIKKVAGEDYSTLVVDENGGTLSITTKSGQVIKYEY